MSAASGVSPAAAAAAAAQRRAAQQQPATTTASQQQQQQSSRVQQPKQQQQQVPRRPPLQMPQVSVAAAKPQLTAYGQEVLLHLLSLLLPALSVMWLLCAC